MYQVADRFTIISHGQKVGDFMKGESAPRSEHDHGQTSAPPVPVIEEREAERRTRPGFGRGDRVVEAKQARTRRRNLAIVGAAILAVIVLAALLISGGVFSDIEPKAEATAIPAVDMASVPEEVLATIDTLLNDRTRGAPSPPRSWARALRHQASVEPLMQALNDEAWEVRAAAAKALGKLGDRRAIDALQPLLRDNVSQVRDAAGEALQVGFGLSCSDAEGCVE